MSNEAPADDEVTTRVRAAVAGDFQPEHVDGFPMRPDQASINLGSIDARSSKPLVKEDDMDRDKRRESIEKLKSAKDLEKKKEKKKNLEKRKKEVEERKRETQQQLQQGQQQPQQEGEEGEEERRQERDQLEELLVQDRQQELREL
ncbi:UPF0329 protein ECU05_1680/ECU11_0050-like [Sorghum bicolor]|uniref:UPF0329 protein ECU05_1680/ECU11_0050-like n=1 Tax=Sorghum bicolor TaxID=4558 RepID=UPI000B425981|nr:UPF0329 protein ECU05_1680/ECU11_0050-like [Sorghum bicolor]|eukprot:XP_021319233.1 UPF0329 protein ECU05_1680/ECU11_0050-like [Sorghum bicolor]